MTNLKLISTTRPLRSKLGVLLALIALGCTDEVNTLRTLENNGFTDIQTTGFNAFQCSKDDTYSTGFTARNTKGKGVSGTVCCGFFKGCTVRF